jgi:hypothetical protein
VKDYTKAKVKALKGFIYFSEEEKVRCHQLCRTINVRFEVGMLLEEWYRWLSSQMLGCLSESDQHIVKGVVWPRDRSSEYYGFLEFKREVLLRSGLKNINKVKQEPTQNEI